MRTGLADALRATPKGYCSTQPQPSGSRCVSKRAVLWIEMWQRHLPRRRKGCFQWKSCILDAQQQRKRHNDFVSAECTLITATTAQPVPVFLQPQPFATRMHHDLNMTPHLANRQLAAQILVFQTRRRLLAQILVPTLARFYAGVLQPRQGSSLARCPDQRLLDYKDSRIHCVQHLLGDLFSMLAAAFDA